MTSIPCAAVLQWLAGGILCSTLVAAPADAIDPGVPRLLGDLRATPVAVTGFEDRPYGLASLGDRLIFDYCEASTGCEAWVSDGTPEGTRLLADLRLGHDNSNASAFVPAGPIALFRAAASAYRGAGPWVTDGTQDLLYPLGGPLLEDPIPSVWSPDLTVPSGPSTFYYWAIDGGVYNLYWYSATSGLQRLLVPIPPGSGPAGTTFEARAFGGLLLFSGCDESSGCEPWLGDGEANSAKRLIDLWPGTGASQPSDFVKLGDNVFFLADDGRGIRGLWRYSFADGSVAPVFHPEPSAAGAVIWELVASSGTLYFGATSAEAGLELWRSDGTAEGTRIVADLLPGSAGSEPEYFFPWGRGLLFTARSSTGDRSAVWVSDGSDSGTLELVRGSFTGHRGPGFLDLKGRVFFAWAEETTGKELWSTDGSPEGTALVLDILPGTPSSEPRLFAELSGKLAFVATDFQAPLSIWTSDGTTAGTRRAVGLGVGNEGSGAAQFTLLGDRLLFVTQEDHGEEALRSMEIVPGAAVDRAEACAPPVAFGERYRMISTLAGSLLFEADCRGQLGYHLTVGRASETTELSGLGGSGTFRIEKTWRAPGGFLASGCTEESGCEPWFLEHSVAGSYLFADLQPGSESSAPESGLSVPDGLIFTVGQPDTGREAWIWEGAPEAPRLLVESAPGSSGWVNLVMRVPSGIAFRNGEFTNFELLGYDLAQGTLTHLAQFAPTNFFFSTSWAATPERTLFSEFAGSPVEVPWVTDGTDAGSHPLFPYSEGPTGPRFFRSFGERVLFTAARPESGTELWVSDGTVVGTRLVADILPGPGSSSPEELVVAGGRAFFRAHDGVHGEELWTTDGTTEGTTMVADLYEGAAGSAPSGLYSAGGYLFFGAFRPDIGWEPWFLAVPGAPLFADDFETRDLLDWFSSEPTE